MSKKLIPFGEISESFTGLRDDGIYYVDKTGFISFLIEQMRKICVVTRPRRFGKTLMLRTLETFFEYRRINEKKNIFLLLKSNLGEQRQDGMLEILEFTSSHESPQITTKC